MSFNKYYILPILAIGLLIITLFINTYRYELFDIKQGYAPYNFGFNIFFFFPSTVLSLIFAIFVVFRKSNPENKKAKLYSIILVSPIFILWIWQIMRFYLAMNYLDINLKDASQPIGMSLTCIWTFAYI